MEESELLGTLLPSHPDLLPIIQAVREKYSLPEISPDDDPITEIYLGYEIIPLEEFRKDIESRINENLAILSPDMAKLYQASKGIRDMTEIPNLEFAPDDIKKGMEASIKFIKVMMNPVYQAVEGMIDSIVKMLYIYLLTGEAEEAPTTWFCNVTTANIMGEPVIVAMASQVADPNVIIQQFREQYKKSFGAYHPKVTTTAVSTAYYLQLQKARKPWNFIVEEYIRLNKFKLPRDRNSKRYLDVHRKIEQRLKKRMQRTETILQVILKDKKS